MSKGIIGISFGHNDKYNVGAVGYLNEDLLNREVGQKVINIINADGKYQAVRLYKENVTSLSDSLASRVIMANSLGCIIAIDIHHNSYSSESANGTEALAMSDRGKKLGKLIVDNVCKDLGYTNRGVKHNTYIFNRGTNMCSLIFEGFFVSSRNDCNKYNADKEAQAIVKGIYQYLGVSLNNNNSAGNTTPSNKVYVVKKGDNLTKIARELNVTINHLVNKNNISNPNLIYVGQKLIY